MTFDARQFNIAPVNSVIDDDDCTAIREAWPKTTIPDLAQEYGVSISSIWNHIHGRCSHDGGAPRTYPGPRHGPWRDRDRWIELYVLGDATSEELADEWGCCLTTVYRWRAKHGLAEKAPSY